MNSLSNILYRVQIAPLDQVESCLIDSNDLVEQSIQKHIGEMERKKRLSASSDAFSPLDLDSASEKGSAFDRDFSEEGYFDGEGQGTDFSDMNLSDDASQDILQESNLLQMQEEILSQAKEEAESILAEANKEAERLLEEAKEQGEAIKSHAKAQAEKAGFDQGMQQAAIKAQEMEDEISKKREAMQKEIDDQKANMEHDLVDVICQVVENVFLIEFGDKKDIILHMLDKALTGIEGSKEFLVRVGENNLEYLRAHKDELQQKVGLDIKLDIVLDPLLDDSQCMIETDGGLFDCSMDTQMKNLVADIKALS